MGYSFSITCKSNAARDRMWTFLQEHYRSPADLGINLRQQGPVLSQSIKYGGNPRSIGFNGPHDYEIALLAWMALRVGKKRSFRGKGITRAVPWINLDAHGSAPVLLRTEFPEASSELQQYLVDADGFAPLERWWLDTIANAVGFETETLRKERLIQDELVRLSLLWEEYVSAASMVTGRLLGRRR